MGKLRKFVFQKGKIRNSKYQKKKKKKLCIPGGKTINFSISEGKQKYFCLLFIISKSKY